MPSILSMYHNKKVTSKIKAKCEIFNFCFNSIKLCFEHVRDIIEKLDPNNAHDLK